MTDTNHTTMALCYYQDGVDPILVGDINVDLSQPEGRWRAEELTSMIAVEGLEYMVTYFRPQQGRRDRQTWRMVRRHQEVVSHPD